MSTQSPLYRGLVTKKIKLYISAIHFKEVLFRRNRHIHNELFKEVLFRNNRHVHNELFKEVRPRHFLKELWFVNSIKFLRNSGTLNYLLPNLTLIQMHLIK